MYSLVKNTASKSILVLQTDQRRTIPLLEQKTKKKNHNGGLKRKREKSEVEAKNLSENPSPFDFLHEIGTDFSLQDVVEETTEQLTVILEALKRNLLRDIVRRIRHRCRFLRKQH